MHDRKTNTRTKAYLVQAVLLLLFSALFMLEPVSFNQLQGAGIEQELLGTTGAAWMRAGIWFLLGAIVLFVLTRFCKPLISPDDDPRRLISYGCLSFFFYYLILTRALQFPISGDDSYIGYRYVHNWVSGLSLNFNPGETVMGMTSHLHLMTLAALSALTHVDDISLLSQSFNVFLQICNYLLVFFVGLKISENRYWATCAAVVYALSTYQVSETVFGKESSLATLLLILSLYAFQLKKDGLRAWLASLLVLTRPEGGLWLGTNIALSWKQKGAKGLLVWILPLLLLLIFAGGLFYLYGSIMPQGFVGKAKMYAPRQPLTAFFILLRRFGYGSFCPEYSFQITNPLISSAYLYVALYGGVIAILAVLKFFDKPVLRYYGLNALAYLLLFSLTNPCMFEWYHCWFSLLPCFLVAELSTRLLAFIKSKPKKLEYALSIFICVYLAFVQFSQTITRPVFGVPAFCFYINDAYRRLLIYRQAAIFLDSLQEPWKVCAVPELGIFSYYYHGKVLDLGGLVSPKMVSYFPLPSEMRAPGSNYAIPPKAISDFRPDYVFTDAIFAKNSIMKDPFFLEHYEKLRFYSFPLWSEGIYLFQRIPGK